MEEVAEGIANARTIQGRSNIIEANGLVIIDDCYNANPMSMKASLNVLKCGLGRTIAVLGDMGELGEQEGHHHYDVGAYAVQNGIDVLFCVGELSKEMERGAREAGGDTQIFYYQGREEMLSHLMDTVCKGDTILVKASHFMKFSKVVEQLLNT